MNRAIPLVAFLLLAASPAWGQALGVASDRSLLAPPAGVSPGSAQAFAMAHPCANFSWTAVAAAQGYELRVYEIDASEQLAPTTALEAKLPAGASSWTPPADRCLAPHSRYAWSVRALSEKASSPWSEALLFEVAPPALDVPAILEILRRALASDLEAGARLSQETSNAARGQEARQEKETDELSETPTGGGPATALLGNVPDVAGETYGARGIVNSPDGAGVRADNNAAGADLVLGGSPVAKLTESTFSRDAAGNLTFDFTNPGAGGMTLQVDGEAVFHAGNDGTGSGLDADLLDGLDSTDFAPLPHTHPGEDIVSGTVADSRIDAAVARDSEILPAVLAGDGAGSTLDADLLDGLDSTAFLGSGTDDWVNEGGDTMTGTLTLSPSAGNALTTIAGNIDLHTAATVTKAGSRFLWDSAVDFSFAAGRGALASHTTGDNDTAVGNGALDANTAGLDNTAVGRDALGANTTGSNNTAVGSFALSANTASLNSALGWNALALNTTGQANTAVGSRALEVNSTASYNTAVGNLALRSNTTGINNTAVGAAALDVNTTGESNTALGSDALGANSIGGGNTAVGEGALRNSNNASNNTAVGASALFNNNADHNTAVGAFALVLNTSGTANTAVGVSALFNNTTATHNSAFGRNALAVNTTGLGNTAVGAYALDANNTASNNTAVGRAALGANVTGASNTGLGAYALKLNTASNNTAVGQGALEANTTASHNSALGRNALAANSLGAGNTAVGAYALDANTTASDNTAVGRAALGANLTGLANTAVGAYALDANTTGAGNTALGQSALRANTTASGNTAVGIYALRLSTGDSNTAVGSYALSDNATGSSNTALGRSALLLNTASYNTAVGANALDANTSGSYNTALGPDTLGANATGSDNTAVGGAALQANTASGNTAVGASALTANTSGTYNVALGRQALTSNNTGTENTALGAHALQSNTTGTDNIAIGTFALQDTTTGTNNIAIGSSAGDGLSDGSNNIFIGSGSVSATQSAKIRLGSGQTETFISGISGNVVVGGSTVIVSSGGDLGTVVSSRRFKEDIVDVGPESEAILALRPVSFRYTKEAAGEGDGPLEYGLIAEEVAEVFPELVVYDREGRPQTVRYHLLVPLMLNELQRQQRELADLRRERAASRRR